MIFTESKQLQFTPRRYQRIEANWANTTTTYLSEKAKTNLLRPCEKKRWLGESHHGGEDGLEQSECQTENAVVQQHQKLDGDGSEGAGRPGDGSGRLQTSSYQCAEGVRDLTTTRYQRCSLSEIVDIIMSSFIKPSLYSLGTFFANEQKIL